MMGLDTNALVRFLVRDDQEQSARAEQLIRRSANAGEPVYISLLVLLETEWVLRGRYKLDKSEILGAFSELLSSADLSFEDKPSIEEALFLWKDTSAQFADCLIGSRHRASACAATATFNSDALKRPGWVGDEAQDPQGSRRQRETQERALDELVKQAQELGLGY
jgi:predicted nucleic-acid-binding protein